MVEVELSRIIIDEERREQVIVLKEKKGQRTLPIVIGASEAVAIKMHLSGFTAPRPMTHDLLKTIFDTFQMRLVKVVIDNLLNGTFHAKLYLSGADAQVKGVDARPSDSIALAVRTKSPLFVRERVFAKLSVQE